MEWKQNKEKMNKRQIKMKAEKTYLQKKNRNKLFNENKIKN